ncbi:hypothetical protein C12CBH8_14950 [Solibaculum mannosilyticum]|uniref:Leucine-rich repeat domain-containing protein n=1 Tax=Solibaculum mannosilyticum TaxID=2780922 RepID=A0A7I8D262_9FIRM|nr:hypothetical protein C12CBH8_14950 [Solibaculum mannosilyticum]
MKYVIDGQTLINIGDAVREKTGKSEQMTPVQMPDEIRGIQGGPEPPSIGFVPSEWDENGYITDGTWYGTTVSEYAFYCLREKPWRLTTLTFADAVTILSDSAFRSCATLALTSLPDSITAIDTYALANCTSLALTSLPSNLASIGNYAFNECVGLTSLTFRSTLSSIPSSAFNKCTNLTEIKVPWAEKAVSGAPWGATNATIIYNYKEE